MITYVIEPNFVTIVSSFYLAYSTLFCLLLLFILDLGWLLT